MWLSNILPLSQKEKELLENAKTLIPSITLVSVINYDELLEKYLVLKNMKETDWNFYFAVAAVAAATVGLEKVNIKSKLKSTISKIYGKALEEWNPKWDESFKDCYTFLYEHIEIFDTPEYEKHPGFRVSDTLGLWLAWNLLSYRPTTNNELELIRPLGLLVTSEFIRWWTK